MLALLGLATRHNPVWPRLRDVVLPLACTAAMASALLPLRGAMTPGLVTLLVQGLAGLALYASLALALDLCGIRTLLLRHFRVAPLMDAHRPDDAVPPLLRESKEQGVS